MFFANLSFHTLNFTYIASIWAGDGFSGDPLGFTDAMGEARLAFPIPVGAFTGISLTLQPVVVAPSAPSGIAIGNAETAIFL